MTLADILTLSKAGFTAAQIGALASTSAAPVAAPVTVPATAPAPAPAPATAPAPAPATVPVTAPVNQYDEILKQLGVINNNMQSSALTMATQPPEKTVDDVIATIINPPTLEQ